MVDIFKEIRYTGSDFGLPTPEDTVKAMLDLVPPDFWGNPNARVLEVNIKDMTFLKACYERFRAKLNLSPEYIWGNMLYGACISDALLLVFKNECPEAVNIGAWRDMKLSDMKFDLVVGNPPYNNDAYLDFVMKGHELSKKYSLWITPAKFYPLRSGSDSFVSRWRTTLRRMLRCVFYQCEDELFPIVMPCGIAYYLLGKEETDTITVENVSRYPAFSAPKTVIGSDCDCFNIKGLDILGKLGGGEVQY